MEGMRVICVGLLWLLIELGAKVNT